MKQGFILREEQKDGITGFKEKKGKKKEEDNSEFDEAPFQINLGGRALEAQGNNNPTVGISVPSVDR